MEYGQIILANTKTGIIPKIIKFFTKSKFSHSLITIPSILDMPMSVEASSSGIDAIRFDTNYMNNKNIQMEIWNVNIPIKNKNKGIIAAINDLEKGYGYLELIWFGWRWLNSLFGRDIKKQNNWFAGDGIICSQLCRYYLSQVGLNKLFADYGKGSICPEDLSKIMNANPKIFTKVYTNF